MLQSTQFHIQSSSFNVACWCKRRLQVGGLHRDKFWLILKPRFGDLQTWNSSVHASSKLELATWRWWDASPGVVVQHLGLSVFSTAGIKHRLHRKGEGFEKNLRIRGQTLHSKVLARGKDESTRFHELACKPPLFMDAVCFRTEILISSFWTFNF